MGSTSARKKVFADGVFVAEIAATGDTMQDALAARAAIEQAGIKRGPPSIEKLMFNQAVAFARTARHVQDRDLRGGPPHNPLGIAPFVVNLAFSIEIYLKTLARVHGVALQGHD